MSQLLKPKLLVAIADRTQQHERGYDYEVGDFIKMSIQFAADPSASGDLEGAQFRNCRGERPWFIVREKRADGTGVAECNNATVFGHIHGVTCGDLVEFRSEHVLSVEKP